MDKRRFNRRSMVVALIVIVGLAVLFGVSASVDQTEAAPPPSIPVSPTIPAPTLDFAPHVSSVSPANGATDVPLGTTLLVKFDREMAASTINSSTFSLTREFVLPNGIHFEADIAATVTVAADGKSATLNPTSDLQPNIHYLAHLSDAIVGGPFSLALKNAPYTWGFTTAAPPAVTGRTPAVGATDVPLDQVISVGFDRAIDFSTATAANFYVRKSGDTTNVTGTISAPTDTQLRFTPDAPLDADTSYTVTVSAAVKGANGLALAGAPLSWSFFTAQATVTPPTFSDVPAGHPYATAIATLASRGIIAGSSDGGFHPDALVTRQQFAKMIVRLLPLTVTGAEVCPFTDVQAQVGDDPLYPSKYVAVCATAGITKGYTPTTFGPADPIKRQQLITMVTRAAALSAAPPSYVPPFTAAQFSLAEHYTNATKAAYAELLVGLVGMGPSYDFLTGATRGECAQILYRLILLRES